MKTLYYLIETERGPEAQDGQEVECHSATDAGRQWAHRVASLLAEGATVRLTGAQHAVSTFTEGGTPVLQISTFVETDAVDDHPAPVCDCPACTGEYR